MKIKFCFADAGKVSEKEIILRPVNYGYIAPVSTRQEVELVYNSPVNPHIDFGVILCALRVEGCVSRFKGYRVRGSEAEQFAGPGWYKIRDVILPEFVIERFWDDVILPG